MNIDDVNDIKNDNQWELWELHQLTANNEKTELNNNEQVSCDVEFNR